MDLLADRVIEVDASDNLALRDVLLEIAEALDRLAHKADVLDKRLGDLVERRTA